MSAVKLTKKQLAQLGAVAALNPELSAHDVISFLNEAGLSEIDNAQILATQDSVIIASNGKLVRRMPVAPSLIKKEVSNG